MIHAASVALMAMPKVCAHRYQQGRRDNQSQCKNTAEQCQHQDGECRRQFHRPLLHQRIQQVAFKKLHGDMQPEQDC